MGWGVEDEEEVESTPATQLRRPVVPTLWTQHRWITREQRSYSQLPCGHIKDEREEEEEEEEESEDEYEGAAKPAE